MRFLHTSDWHLGRQFHQSSLLEEQAAAVDRMVELAAAESVDAVIVAGDLFDRAIPSTGAVELLDEALVRLRDTGAVVVAVTGNHDSPSRAGFGDRLLTRAGVTVRSDPRRAAEPVLVTDLRSGDGTLAVACYPVPYLDPVAVTGDPPDADVATPRRATHESVLRGVLRGVHADRAGRSVPSVVVAHAFVANFAPRLGDVPVEESDSERPLSVGGSDRVDQAAFAGFDYVALGHLHGQQAWDADRIAYSGSPLPYSFSEQDHRKGVRIVEMDGTGLRSARHVPLGVGRGLCTLTGTLEDLLGRPEHSPAEQLRVRAVLTDAHLPIGAMARLRQRFPHAAEVVHEPPERDRIPSRHTSQQIRRRLPLDLAMEFAAEQLDADPDAATSRVLRRAVAAAIGVDR